MWVLSMGYSPSGRDCSCMGCSPWDTVPLRRTCTSMGSSQVAASIRAYPHCCTVFFYPKFVPREEPPAFLFASVLVSDFSVLELFGTVSVQHGGSLWCLLTEAIPAAPMLPKPCHINTMEYSFVQASSVVAFSHPSCCSLHLRRSFQLTAVSWSWKKWQLLLLAGNVRWQWVLWLG